MQEFSTCRDLAIQQSRSSAVERPADNREDSGSAPLGTTKFHGRLSRVGLAAAVLKTEGPAMDV